MVVSLPTVAANEVVGISLPTVASLLPVVSLPTVAAETLLVVSLPTVATNEGAEVSLPPVASLLPAVSLPTAATESPAVSLPTVATDPPPQSTTLATTSGSTGKSSNEGSQALTVSDSSKDSSEAETRIDHQVDDDDKRISPNSIRTIDGLDSSSSSDGGSSESRKSNDKSRKRSQSPSDDRRRKKNRHLRGPITTETHPLDMATTGRDNSLGTIVATMDSIIIALPIKIVQIVQTSVTRINIETSLVIILITTIDNTIVCLTLTFTSKTVRDITPAETKIMRDPTRIPHAVSKTMTGI